MRTVSPWKLECATGHGHIGLYLRTGRTNTGRVRVTDRDGGETLSEPLEFKTDPLPDDFPPIDLKISRPRRMEPGVTLVPFFRWPGPGPDETFGLVVALDAHGEVVWYFRADHTVSDLVRIDSGHFIYQDGRPPLLYEIEILGN